MSKPKYQVRCTYLGYNQDSFAIYGATSQTVLGASYRVHIENDGGCRCNCPGHGKTWTKRAAAAGSRVCLTDDRFWCPHVRAVVAELYRARIIRAVLMTPCGELPLMDAPAEMERAA